MQMGPLSFSVYIQPHIWQTEEVVLHHQWRNIDHSTTWPQCSNIWLIASDLLEPYVFVFELSFDLKNDDAMVDHSLHHVGGPRGLVSRMRIPAGGQVIEAMYA